MKFSGLKQVSSHLILALTVILVFLLVFEKFIRFPNLVLYLGHFHPVILHFPIVLLILAVINSWTPAKPYQEFLFPVATLSALVTALTGFILSFERASKGDLLFWHQWLGAGTAIAAALWYGLENSAWKSRGLTPIIKIFIVLIVVVAGHFGGMVTHGRDFLSFSKKNGGMEIPQNPYLFQHLLLPVLTRNCVPCHNPDKSKGGLVMTDFRSLMAGGKSGPVLIPGDTINSEILRRISLPENDEDHMPPEGRKSLDQDEILFIENWIREGASDSLRYSELKPGSRLHDIAQNLMPARNNTNRKDLPAADESLIKKLSSDYCTISRIAKGSDALAIVLFPHPGKTAQEISDLKPLAGNIISLDLSNLTLGENDLRFIASCHSLEWLEIDHTKITDEQLRLLSGLTKLSVLKIYGTALSDKSIDIFQSMPGLTKIFIWETGISEAGLQKLKISRPEIHVNSGPGNEIHFTSILPVPDIEPDQQFFIEPINLRFRHPLKDIDIFYTENGNNPASGGNKFKDTLGVDHTMVLKYIASKQGWESSPVDSVSIFRTIQGPDHYELRFPPDPKYGGHGALTLFDLKKGTFNLTDSAWLGFQGKTMELRGEWNKPVILSSITLSSMVNTGISIFPPVSIEIRGGPDRGSNTLLGRLILSALKEHQGSKFMYYNCSLKKIPLKYINVIVKPVEKLPAWHESKGSPGWFFIDEILLEDPSK